MIDRRTGLDGKRYGIGFAVALPDDWNGRLLMQGGGGLNGRVAPPVGGVAAGDTPALARGFAVVTTDTGHEGAVFDARFMRDQQAGLDFAYVAVGRVALAAKDVVARYYGRPAAKAYFAGCSTGGREGMLMAQRYPAYFDGIIAGAPAMRTGHSNLAVRAMRVAFNRLAPPDAAGKPQPALAFSDADRKAVVQGLLDACDANDGAKDGLIFDTRGCRFSPASLACKGPKADGCLSAPQVAAIEKAFAGPRDSKGRQVYPKFLYDTGIVTAGPGIPGILMPNAGSPVPPVPGFEQDVDAEARVAEEDAQQALTDTATLDQPEHVLGARRQAALLPRRQRPVVLGDGHRRVLRAARRDQRRRRRGARLEPPVPLAGHGPLRRRGRRARSVRPADAARRVGGEGHGAGRGARDRAQRRRDAAGRCAPTRSTRTTRAPAIPRSAASFECRP